MTNGTSRSPRLRAKVVSRRSWCMSGRNCFTSSNSLSSLSSWSILASTFSSASTSSCLSGSLCSSSSTRSSTSERRGTQTPSSTSALHFSWSSSTCRWSLLWLRFVSMVLLTNAKVGSSGPSPVGSAPSPACGPGCVTCLSRFFSRLSSAGAPPPSRSERASDALKAPRPLLLLLATPTGTMPFARPTPPAERLTLPRPPPAACATLAGIVPSALSAALPAPSIKDAKDAVLESLAPCHALPPSNSSGSGSSWATPTHASTSGSSAP
mmetsp:Transcript_42770/g.99018  ORF Transcript_42770/g.99018 Transcript_42770/m.99018 type:complete len:267 (-) Transcript_42770:498-1298(-)